VLYDPRIGDGKYTDLDPGSEVDIPDHYFRELIINFLALDPGSGMEKIPDPDPEHWGKFCENCSSRKNEKYVNRTVLAWEG
jgi:hypothetical protein